MVKFFVLKHEKFSHLREVETFPNTINPHKQESLYLIKSMIDQVMAAHVGIRWFHIGSDEVYYLGEGGESKDLILQQQFSMESMYMSHVKAVATQVLANNPGVKPIIWDDYLRNIDEDKLKESMLGKLVEPMIWNYNSVLDVPNIRMYFSFASLSCQTNRKSVKCFPVLLFFQAQKCSGRVQKCCLLLYAIYCFSRLVDNCNNYCRGK
uniref:beta-N-acetylhexosaminidase n=1 Tax=Callorhinchus milii TaxID=7868 RepID=V9KV32_CALMI